MSDETTGLAAGITTALYEHFFNRLGAWHFEGERYDIADDEQYEALGEDVNRTDLPLILVRESDGKFFEVELDATARETTAEARKADLDRLRALHERAEAYRARKAGAS